MYPRLVVFVLASSLCVACVDSGKRFDDFEDNVVDAAPRFVADARPLDQLPDISGTFYLALTLEIAPTTPFQFRGDYELTRNADGTGVLDIAMIGLSTAERVPVGPTNTSLDNAVNASGQFRAPFAGMVAGAANPLTGSDVTMDLALVLTIQDENTLCGIAEGLVTQPIMLDITGATAIVLRTAPDATGDDLPAATTECPDSTTPDAGPTDAATPDAATPDAS